MSYVLKTFYRENYTHKKKKRRKSRISITLLYAVSSKRIKLFEENVSIVALTDTKQMRKFVQNIRINLLSVIKIKTNFERKQNKILAEFAGEHLKSIA